MKYPIDEELIPITKQSMPANPKLLPAMNVIMKVFRCRPDESVDVIKTTIPGYQGAKLKAYVIEPKEKGKNMPCLVFFHGGGFMLKASGAHYRIAKEYAAKTPCKVVYVDYRLAPKYKFPVPVEDCYATYKWTLDNADKLGIDAARIAIGGDSAGGNLAATVTLMARDRGLKLPCYALLIYPVTDRRMATESMKKYVDTPVWDAVKSKMMWDCYLGNLQPERIEYASPVEATDLRDFPPAYFEVAEFDSLRDEGIMLYDRLKEAGVEAELYEIKRACHGFEVAYDSKITRAAVNRRISRLQKHV